MVRGNKIVTLKFETALLGFRFALRCVPGRWGREFGKGGFLLTQMMTREMRTH